MFRRIAMVNYVKIDKQVINIICHTYKKIMVRDILIQVYQGKLYYYTIKQIFGYKEQTVLETEEGSNYRIEIELQEKKHEKVIEKLLYGDYLFGREVISSKETLFIKADFELDNKREREQYYKFCFFYKNYDSGVSEIHKIANMIYVLQESGYEFCYDRKGNYISDFFTYVAEEKANRKLIHLNCSKNSFYLHGVIGYENKCMINRIEIILPEKCIFYGQELNNELFILFKKLNNIISPYWSYIGNFRNAGRFPYDGSNLPTSIHHINYYCKELVQQIQYLFDIDLTEYLIIRKFPFNNYLQSDLQLQKYYYQNYGFDKMLKYLQKTFFESEEELLLYCNMLCC